MSKDEEIQQLKNEKASLEEKLRSYIPRRRVRRVFKQLKHILEQDVVTENTAYMAHLKVVITKYRNKEEVQLDEPTIVAIEHLLGFYDETNGWG